MKLSQIFVLSLGLGFLTAWGCSISQKKSESENLKAMDPQVMKNYRQITFAGQRAGEGYFSQDGKYFVFQSERHEGNPFYQIYWMDLKTGKTNRVSTGKGQTTCAWIHPNNKKVMFSSTHLDPENSQKVQNEYASRKSNKKQKYSWSYDDSYDIYTADPNGKNLRRLTTEKGYDAEGSFSPDGTKILFASNRGGYIEKLSSEDAKLFAQDPSYMMDLYEMDINGKNLRRLTTEKGYDGGPFYNFRGDKITWRRFSPTGHYAEIMIMNSDGSNQKTLTNWKKMSWAPYFHPSDKYVIFTSNFYGYTNFELFIVSTDGDKEPIRVSYLEGFDGLPVFSPDGKTLSWTRRNEKGESQIYFADWDHDKALELLGLPPEKLPKKEIENSLKIPSYAQLQYFRDWVYYFASEDMAGRLTGSSEEKVYMQKIEKFFKEKGLSFYPGMKDFKQNFEFPSGVSLGKNNTMSLVSGKRQWQLEIKKDFIPHSASASAEIKKAGVAFAGYGIVAEATDQLKAYNSYQGLDVNGKWVLILTDIPENISMDMRLHLNTFSRVHHKVLMARERGAKGVLVALSGIRKDKTLPELKFEGEVAGTSLPVIFINTKVLEEILLSSGQKISDLRGALNQGEIRNFEIKDIQISAQVELESTKSTGQNTIGYLPVPGAQETIMIGAHGDHLGRGEIASSLGSGKQRNQIHFGADDNASGMSLLLSMVEWASENKKILKKNLAFAVWSGEEIGLIGSNSFLNDYKTPHLYINLDMVGRYRDMLYIQGLASAKEHKTVLERVAVSESNIRIMPSDDPYLPTDAMAFYMKSVPVVSLFTGAHTEYHTPADKPETLNYEGMFWIGELLKKLTVEYQRESLKYVKVESKNKNLPGRQFRLYLGTIPDYSGAGQKGVKISGTTKSSPAEKAGLQAGDVLIEMAGKKIENIYDYVYLLQAMKANEEVEVKVLRGGVSKTLKITPMLKE